MAKILIRFDDICPTMNYKQFNRAKEIWDKIAEKPLLGVIPDCKDPELMIDDYNTSFWDEIRKMQDEGYSIAMHGNNHIYDSKSRGMTNIRKVSEFAGHSLDAQIMKIRAGKKCLEEHGISTDIFIAPGHSYDANTLKALSLCGFKYMSDGMSAKPYYSYGILCLPCRSYGVPQNIKESGYITAVFHAHEWEQPGKETGYDKLCEIYDTYKEDIVGFRGYLKCGIGNPIIQKANERAYVFLRRIKYNIAQKRKEHI